MSNLKNKMRSTVEAASILGISAAYLRKLMANGIVKAEKVGINWILYDSDLRKFKRQRFKKIDTESK